MKKTVMLSYKMENLELTMSSYIKVKILEMKIILIMGTEIILPKMKKLSRMSLILKVTNLK